MHSKINYSMLPCMLPITQSQNTHTLLWCCSNWELRKLYWGCTKTKNTMTDLRRSAHCWTSLRNRTPNQKQAPLDFIWYMHYSNNIEVIAHFFMNYGMASSSSFMLTLLKSVSGKANNLHRYALAIKCVAYSTRVITSLCI